MNINTVYIRVVDDCFTNMLAANGAVPYSHKEYTRWLNQAKAACVLLVHGDLLLAGALVNAFHDSNESMQYYLNRYTRDELLDFARIDPTEDEDVPSVLQLKMH
jgi:hypothetical protein